MLLDYKIKVLFIPELAILPISATPISRTIGRYGPLLDSLVQC